MNEEIKQARLKSIFSNRVKIARNQKNLTQKQLGNELGVSRTTIANYENPNIDLLPSIENCFKLAHILDVSMDYLSGRTIDPSTKIEHVGDVLTFIDRLLDYAEQIGIDTREYT